VCSRTLTRSAAQTMRFEAPRLGGSFAVWGGLFSAFDCTLVAVRKKARRRLLTPALAQPHASRARRRTPGTPSPPAHSQAASYRCVGAACTRAADRLLTSDALASLSPPQLRHGLASAGRSAAFGGILLAGIEGIGIMITRLTAPPPPPGLDEMLAPAMAPAPSAPAAAGPSIFEANAGAGAESAAPSSAPKPGGGAAGGGGWFKGGWFEGGSSRKAQAPQGGSEAPPMPDFGVQGGGDVFK